MPITTWEAQAMESFADRLKCAIEDKYGTLGKFSEETGIPLSTVRNWNYSLQYPDIRAINNLVKYLDMPADELLWNGAEWNIARRKAIASKLHKTEYTKTISEWKNKPFHVLLNNAILYEYGSIKECALWIGISKMTLENYVSGKRIPSTKYLKKICEWFNVSADDALETIFNKDLKEANRL